MGKMVCEQVSLISGIARTATRAHSSVRPGSGGAFVLVLSIAVLVLSIAVLVLDCVLSHGMRSWDQSNHIETIHWSRARSTADPRAIWSDHVCWPLRDALIRESITIESFIVERRFCHHAPFEYEYRGTEYEYESPEEQLAGI